MIASRSRSRTRAGALGALIAALMASSLIWILADRSVWPWDQAWYGEVALDLWHARHDGWSAWLSALVHAIGAKPPLLVWLGQFFIPLSALTGDVESSLLLLNVAAACATLALIAVAASDMGVGWRGRTAAVLLCGGASLFIGMTHQFMVEMLQALGVAAALLVAARARRLPFFRTVALGVLVAGAAVLTKASSVLFVAPPLAYAVVTSFCERRNRSAIAPGDIALGLASAACAAAAVAWYVVNWRAMLGHAVASTTGDAALLYGSPPSLAKLSFWTNALALAVAPAPWIGLAVLILAAAALAVALFELRHRSKPQWIAAAIEDGTVLAAILAATIVAAVLVYSLQVNEETRFITPLLPIAALLVAWSLRRLGKAPVATVVIFVLAANALAGHLFAHGVDPFHLHPSPWLKKGMASDEERSTLARVVAQTCPPSAQGRYTIVGVEYPALNANSAAFYSAKARLTRGYRCSYTSLGYAETDVQRAIARIFALDAAYVVTVRPDAQPPEDAFNRVSRAVAQMLAADPRFTLLPSGDGAVLIYRRAILVP